MLLERPPMSFLAKSSAKERDNELLLAIAAGDRRALAVERMTAWISDCATGCIS